MNQQYRPDQISQLLVIIGLFCLSVGLSWPWLARLGLGKLPGDIVLERSHFKLYVPLTTSVLLSLFLSIAGWLLRK